MNEPLKPGQCLPQRAPGRDRRARRGRGGRQVAQPGNGFVHLKMLPSPACRAPSQRPDGRSAPANGAAGTTDGRKHQVRLLVHMRDQAGSEGLESNSQPP